MLSLLVSGLGFVACTVPGAHAGSRAWESNVKYSRAVQHEVAQARDLSFQPYGNNTDVIKSRNVSSYEPLPNAQYHYHNSSSQSIHRRWFGIEEGGLGSRFWPQGNIKVCFDETMWGAQSTEQILRGPLEEARGLWRDKGLDDDRDWFKWEVQDDLAWCRNRNNRPDFLLVTYAGPGVTNMATTPGMGPKLSTTNMDTPYERLGPRMVLSDVLTMGHRNVVANYAHEMGHSWGFHHEHQNPDWWAEGFSGEPRDDYFFGDGSFFCERLADYGAAVARIDASSLSDGDKAIEKRKICRKRADASGWEFAGGLNYLPVLSGAQWDKKKEPDWTSIMIYPSTAGNGNAGDGTGEAILLTKPNGDVIKPVTRPSSLDVEGLRKMYKGSPKKSIGKLLNRKGSQFFNKFKSVLGKDQDAGCLS
ncbi:hypothetical protein F4677DRAFT_184063 [Hypoxylon crocopeplum]|nr:hypothetical protein F4677DRAFT_184063 [Hypoxylon crocopeplum]